jgi:hypothetical protein
VQVSQVSTTVTTTKQQIWRRNLFCDFPICRVSVFRFLVYLREFPSPKWKLQQTTRIWLQGFSFLDSSGCDVLLNNSENKKQKFNGSRPKFWLFLFIILVEASSELFVPLKVKRLECSSTNLLTDRLRRCHFSCANRNPGCVWFISSYLSLGTNNLGTPCNRFFLFNFFLIDDCNFKRQVS